MTSQPANFFEQANIHNNHILVLIYLLKKYLANDIIILQEDISKVVGETDTLAIRLSPENDTARVFVKSIEPHEVRGVSYVAYETLEESLATQDEKPDKA